MTARYPRIGKLLDIINTVDCVALTLVEVAEVVRCVQLHLLCKNEEQRLSLEKWLENSDHPIVESGTSFSV